ARAARAGAGLRGPGAGVRRAPRRGRRAAGRGDGARGEPGARRQCAVARAGPRPLARGRHGGRAPRVRRRRRPAPSRRSHEPDPWMGRAGGAADGVPLRRPGAARGAARLRRAGPGAQPGGAAPLRRRRRGRVRRRSRPGARHRGRDPAAPALLPPPAALLPARAHGARRPRPRAARGPGLGRRHRGDPVGGVVPRAVAWPRGAGAAPAARRHGRAAGPARARRDRARDGGAAPRRGRPGQSGDRRAPGPVAAHRRDARREPAGEDRGDEPGRAAETAPGL
ncbi:MAG: hypothetical protein AVDCRST_MAG54-2586, partial [uncultured Actinomycetospora sp.]